MVKPHTIVTEVYNEKRPSIIKLKFISLKIFMTENIVIDITQEAINRYLIYKINKIITRVFRLVNKRKNR